MSQSAGWMPELVRRLNEACASSSVFSTLNLNERLPAGRQLCLELWPFIQELPANIQAVRDKMPVASSNLDGAYKLLNVLADEERLYQRLYLKQCLLSGLLEGEVSAAPASARANRLAKAMKHFCQESTYTDGVYAIIAAELAATAFARCALPWFEEYFRDNSNQKDLSISSVNSNSSGSFKLDQSSQSVQTAQLTETAEVEEGLAWLRHHAKPHLRQAIWMRRMLEDVEKNCQLNGREPDRQTLEVILSAVFDILEVSIGANCA